MADNLIVTVQDTSLVNATSNFSNLAVLESIELVADVDTTTNGKANGSVLVYKTTTNKWTSTRTLDLQNLEGGEF